MSGLDSIYKRANKLLTLYFRSRKEREYWFDLAFFGNDEITAAIEFEGTADQFTMHCTRELRKYGDVDGRPALSILLETIASKQGASKQQEFNELAQALLKSQRSQEAVEVEQAYLDRLEKLTKQTVPRFVKLSGEGIHHADEEESAAFLLNPGIEFLARKHRESERRNYDDIFQAFQKNPRTVLLGAPGAGKTTSLIRLAHSYIEAAREDSKKTLPLFIQLGYWESDKQSCMDFFASRLEELAGFLPDLLQQKRVVLLLDGLNEIPTAQRGEKTNQLKQWLEEAENKDLSCIISCRQEDYEGQLDDCLDSLTLKPLPIERIREFINRHMNLIHRDDLAKAEQETEHLFWTIAGGEPVQQLWCKWQDLGASLAQFFEASEIPKENPDVYHKTSVGDDTVWYETVKHPTNLMQLARTPYFLAMLLEVYRLRRQIPRNRASLFRDYIESLFARVQQLTREPLIVGQGDYTEQGRHLLSLLGTLAWQMQTRRIEIQSAEEDEEEETAQVVLPLAEVLTIFDEDQLQTTRQAQLLEVGAQVRFNHQLLQEYFVALGMKERLEAGNLDARKLWSNKWERSGWEEATVLLAGLYPDDCTPVIKWVCDIRPETAAQCINDSGSMVSNEMLEDLRSAWLPLLTDIKQESHPYARAAIGRALGRLSVDDYPMDNRLGVWGVYLAQEERAVVDIDWVKIPGGKFIYQDGKKRELDAFYISRYPITHSQFQAFIDDPDGYTNDRWWQGIERPSDGVATASWSFTNHPRETVDWYEAVAFCRWLSEITEKDISLPTEEQYERAARGRKGNEYPWGKKYQSGYANIDETDTNFGNDKVGELYLRQTSPVGIYPQGKSPEGVLDLSGNVWEWCLNKSEESEVITIDNSGASRVLRGGSWDLSSEVARAAVRVGWNLPSSRDVTFGFRLARLVPHADL